MKAMLIIDRSEINASSLAKMFERRGWSVITCNDRDRAMDRMAGDEPYDVVLFGYQVPETDAVKLVRFIRALEHRRTTAIIVLSGSREVTEQARAAGADDVLLKPDANTLVGAVDKHVA